MEKVAEINPVPIDRGVAVSSLGDGKRQIITIHADGSISGLTHKPNTGLKLTDMGHASVVRVSTIEWDATSQKWCVKFLAGPQAGQFMTWREMILISPDLKDHEAFVDSGSDQSKIVSFHTYELAVNAEIDYFNHQRLAGNMTETDRTI